MALTLLGYASGKPKECQPMAEFVSRGINWEGKEDGNGRQKQDKTFPWVKSLKYFIFQQPSYCQLPLCKCVI